MWNFGLKAAARRRSLRQVDAATGVTETAIKSHEERLEQLETMAGAAKLRDDARQREITALSKDISSLANAHYETRYILSKQSTELRADVAKLNSINRPTRYTIAELVDALADVALLKAAPMMRLDNAEPFTAMTPLAPDAERDGLGDAAIGTKDQPPALPVAAEPIVLNGGIEVDNLTPQSGLVR